MAQLNLTKVSDIFFQEADKILKNTKYLFLKMTNETKQFLFGY